MLLSKDKTKFATAGGDRVSFLWDVATGRVIRRLQGHSQRLNAVHLNDSANILLTGSYDKTICIWDLKSNMREPIQTLADFRDSVTSISTSRYEIIAGCVDGTIRIYDIRMGQLRTDYLNDAVTHLQISKDQKCTLATCLGGPIQLLENSSGNILKRYYGYEITKFKVIFMLIFLS